MFLVFEGIPEDTAFSDGRKKQEVANEVEMKERATKVRKNEEKN